MVALKKLKLFKNVKIIKCQKNLQQDPSIDCLHELTNILKIKKINPVTTMIIKIS